MFEPMSYSYNTAPEENYNNSVDYYRSIGAKAFKHKKRRRKIANASRKVNRRISRAR